MRDAIYSKVEEVTQRPTTVVGYMTLLDGARGVRVETVSGTVFDTFGKSVCYVDHDSDGRIYYCSGDSYPAIIVSHIIY